MVMIYGKLKICHDVAVIKSVTWAIWKFKQYFVNWLNYIREFLDYSCDVIRVLLYFSIYEPRYTNLMFLTQVVLSRWRAMSRSVETDFTHFYLQLLRSKLLGSYMSSKISHNLLLLCFSVDSFASSFSSSKTSIKINENSWIL